MARKVSSRSTTFQTRLEISEHATAGLIDTQIATVAGCSIWTVRKWRRRSRKLGRGGLASVVALMRDPEGVRLKRISPTVC